MVEFGLKLEDNKVADWSDHYLRYEKLKQILNRCAASRKRYQELVARDPVRAAALSERYINGSLSMDSLSETTKQQKPQQQSTDGPAVSVTAAERSLLSPPSDLPPHSTTTTSASNSDSATAGQVVDDTAETTETERLLSSSSRKRDNSYGSTASGDATNNKRFSARHLSGIMTEYFGRSYERQIKDSLREKRELEQDFEQLLVQDLQCVNKFYAQQLHELEERLVFLKESVADALGIKVVSRTGNSEERDEEDPTVTVSQSLEETPLIHRKTSTGLAQAIRRRMIGSDTGATTHSASRHQQKTSEMALPVVDHDDEQDDDDDRGFHVDDTTSNIPPPPPADDRRKIKEAESIQRALVDQYRTAKLLHNFAIMNYTGFVKIIKKYNKTVKENKDKFKETIEPQNICNEGKDVEAFTTLLEKLYANWFCDRNVSAARAQLLPKKGDGLQTDWSQLRLGYRMGMCSVLGLWVCWDCIWGLVSDGNTTIGARSAFPVFRACAGLLSVEWFWGCSVWVWTRYRVNYIYIMELDPSIVRSPVVIFNEAVDDTLLFLLSMLLYYKSGAHDIPGDFPPGVFPAFIVLYAIYRLLFPLKIRMPMWTTVFEVVTAPMTSPGFFHSYVGDIFTSMVKVFQDVVWTICFISSGDWLLSEDGHHASKHTWSRTFWYTEVVIPVVTLLPLWFRFNQCLRRYMDTRKRFPNLANAAKYALSQTVTLFGAFHPLSLSNRGESPLFQLFWSFAFVGSSLYSFIWDVYMDWGLGIRKFKFLGPRLMYPTRGVYYLIIGVDLVLRFAWVLTLIPPNSGATFALPAYLTAVSMFLELGRRTIWGFLRLENEHRNNTSGYRRVGFVPLHFSTGHGHGYSKEKTRRGVAVLLEVAAVTVVVVGAAIVSVVVAQHATVTTAKKVSKYHRT